MALRSRSRFGTAASVAFALIGQVPAAAQNTGGLWGQSVEAFKAEYLGVRCTAFEPSEVMCSAGREVRPRLGALGVIPGPCLDEQVAGFKRDRLTSVSCKVSVQTANLMGADLTSKYGRPAAEASSIMQMQMGHTQWRAPGAYVMIVEYRGTTLNGDQVHNFQIRFSEDSALPLGGGKAAGGPVPATQNPPAAARAVQPSFDCARAKSDAERLICADPELAALDQQLAGWQTRAMQSAADPKLLRAQNIAAWKDRELRCRDKSCLLDWYSSRRAALGASQN
jgi:hypothetical protein